MGYIGPGRESKVWLNELLKNIHETNRLKSTVELGELRVESYSGGGHISDMGYAVSAVPASSEMHKGIDFSVKGVQVYSLGSKMALITEYMGSNPFGDSNMVDLDRLAHIGDKRRTKDNGLRKKGEIAKEIVERINTHYEQNEVPFVGDATYQEALLSRDNTMVFLINAS